MRGKVADFKTTGDFAVLNFSGHTTRYAYRLIEFRIWSSGSINRADEMEAVITTGKTAGNPAAPDLSDAGTIGVATGQQGNYSDEYSQLVDDLYLITQNIILTANDYQGNNDVNYFCRFVSEKMTGPEEAAANYKQFAISDG